MAPVAISPLRLGHYRILRRLDAGGMAEIYLAYDEHDQREVALKVVGMALEDHVQRFQREVEALRLLKHEHILPVFDMGEQDGWLYFAMPYLPLRSLRERLMVGPLTLQEAGAIFDEVADALQYAHERGVLHRDIKPSNILFRNEQDVYLADFGLAKLVEREGSITQTGCLIGTPHYLAPELANEEASQKSDQYALGILLYKMLTGNVPFQGTNAVTICWKHIHDQPLPPSSLNPAISPAIDHVILRALQKDPAHRFDSVRAMAEAYQQALHEVKQPRETGGWSHYFTWKYPLMSLQLEKPVPSTKMRKRRPLLNRFARAATAGAMVVAFCVAPLYLGYSLYRGNAGSMPVDFQSALTLLAAQPFLQGNARPSAGQATALPFTLSPILTSSNALAPSRLDESLPTVKKQPNSGKSQVSKATGLTQSKETEESGEAQSKGGGGEVQSREDREVQDKGKGGEVESKGNRGEGPVHAKGNGKLHSSKRGGKQAGHPRGHARRFHTA